MLGLVDALAVADDEERRLLRRLRVRRHRLVLEAQDFTRVLTPSPGRLPRGIWAGSRFPGRKWALPRHTSWWPGSEALSA